MTATDTPDQVVAAPTYLADIRFFFRSVDIDHMAAKGIELGTYDDVKRNALAVLAHTAPPNATMPPDAEGKWSAARSQTFKNWITNQYPLGSASTPTGGTTPVAPATGDRVRKDVTTLSAQEVSALQTAFEGLMKRDPGDATSYFALAGIHGLPEAWCLHHEDRFNPWHRVYLRVFEDALRSIPGCEDVTLPYWDITTPLPGTAASAPV